jgi:hypothetical protein
MELKRVSDPLMIKDPTFMLSCDVCDGQLIGGTNFLSRLHSGELVDKSDYCCAICFKDFDKELFFESANSIYGCATCVLKGIKVLRKYNLYD